LAWNETCFKFGLFSRRFHRVRPSERAHLRRPLPAFGFTEMLPYNAVLGLSVVAGFIAQGNFSNLTSGVLAVAAPRYLRPLTLGSHWL